jgi:sugar phosphate isomerase/epimerase
MAAALRGEATDGDRDNDGWGRNPCDGTSFCHNYRFAGSWMRRLVTGSARLGAPPTMFKNLSPRGLGISGRQSEIIELALSFGFHGLDLDIADFADQVEAYGLPHARRLLDSARVRIGTIRLPVTWDTWDKDEATYRSGLETLPHLAELAAAVGARRCVTTVMPASDERPYHENFEFQRRRLAEMASILQAHQIQLGLEMVAPAHHRAGKAFQFIHTFDALALLAKSVSGVPVGVVLDAWHLHVARTPFDEIQKLPPDLITAVYMSDAPAGADEHCDESQRHLPGTLGTIDPVPMLLFLGEIGYTGPVSPRADASTLAGKRRDEIVRLASQQLDHSWKAAGLNSTGKLAAARSS